VKDRDICKCGHGREEHNLPNTWDEEDFEDTFCFHKDCTCEKYEPIELNPPRDNGL
jgi:hypothetical protein